jgi:hypothetical protein|tara:strand:- start:89 stop:301 length:213 start_codon:yes stop_codon:yes gene_type:complete
MSNDNNKPAFPSSYIGQNKMPVWSEGISIRDYFAAKAMQGYIAGDYDVYPHEIAQRAYAIADAMLEEQAK